MAKDKGASMANPFRIAYFHRDRQPPTRESRRADLWAVAMVLRFAALGFAVGAVALLIYWLAR
jgi:hypothetical protein